MKIQRLANIREQAVSHNPAITKKVMFGNQQFAPITQFAQATFPPGTTAPAHAHSDMIEVFYILEGRGYIIIDQQRFALEAGSSVLVEAGEQHELGNDSDSEMRVNYFSIAVAQN